MPGREAHLGALLSARVPRLARLAPAEAERIVATILRAAEETHPRVTLEPTRFVEHLARHVADADDPQSALAGIDGPDLYLACACGAGDAVALATFDRECLARVSGYVARVDSSPDFLADVLQALRVQLLASDAGDEPGILDYAGRSPLRAWLRVVAVRAARRMSKRDARYVTLRSSAGGSAGRADASPEHHVVRDEGTREIERAFATSLASMSDRDRTLLRLYFVEGMSLAALGRIYHVHESTMQRRLQALRERLFDALKANMSVDSRGLESRLALVRSQLDLHLSQHLGRRDED